MVACNICRNINYSALNLNLESAGLIVLWFTPIIAEIIDNYPRWTFYTASVYKRDWPIFARMWIKIWREICFVWDDETNRCVICHIKCQRVNRIIGWKKAANRCASSPQGACELPIKGAGKIRNSSFIEQDLIEQITLVLMVGYHSTFSVPRFDILVIWKNYWIVVSDRGLRGSRGWAKKWTLVSVSLILANHHLRLIFLTMQ